jgi:hypothetical protein
MMLQNDTRCAIILSLLMQIKADVLPQDVTAAVEACSWAAMDSVTNRGFFLSIFASNQNV